MIVDANGEVCGCTGLSKRRGGPGLYVELCELYPHVKLHEAMPSLLRLWQEHGEGLPHIQPATPPLTQLELRLGRAHPIYDVLGETLAPRVMPPYAWYVRVPNIPAFIQQIAPVLEVRLVDSLLRNYTGTLKIDLYRDGLQMVFADGKLTSVEPWRAPIHGYDAGAGCPPLVFLQLLLGYRHLAELKDSFPDVWTRGEERTMLIDVLFPAQPSHVSALV